jgi:Zn-dependent membrane protease YugP
MYFLDTGMMYFVLPALVFAFWAQNRVKTAFKKNMLKVARSGVTGNDVARDILKGSRIHDVSVEVSRGTLSDHYDSRAKAVRLSPEVYQGQSLAALGVAAHEAGHAIQHDVGYAPLGIRNAIFPVASLGSNAAFPLFFIGFILQYPLLMDLGILFFLGAVIFQVVTLPVEFNASNRALALLEGQGYITGDEVGPVKEVLNAAALTYVAATAMALAQLLRLVLLRSRRD